MYSLAKRVEDPVASMQYKQLGQFNFEHMTNNDDFL